MQTLGAAAPMPTRLAGTWTGPGAAPLRPIHPKDVDKPEKYGGSVDDWLQWSTTFKQFLDGKDPRWEPLLEEVKKLRSKPVMGVSEQNWQAMSRQGRLSTSRSSSTRTSSTRAVRAVVEAVDVHGALDVWRQLADKGHSQRETHAMALRKKAYSPRKAVQSKDLEVAIAHWEKDVSHFACATSDRISDANLRVMLINTCPERLRCSAAGGQALRR